MEIFRATHKGMIGMLLLLLLGFFGLGNVGVVAKQDRHSSMNHSQSNSSSDCQTRCSSIANPAAAPGKENDEKEKKPDPTIDEPLRIYPFKFAAIKKLSLNSERDARLLRPPDKLALNCIYRI